MFRKDKKTFQNKADKMQSYFKTLSYLLEECEKTERHLLRLLTFKPLWWRFDEPS